MIVLQSYISIDGETFQECFQKYLLLINLLILMISIIIKIILIGIDKFILIKYRVPDQIIVFYEDRKLG